MKQELINSIIQQMLPHLSNLQLKQLEFTLQKTLPGESVEQPEKNTDQLKTAFIAAKHIEGCSDKTLGYYNMVISTAIEKIGKEVLQITTEDLRNYLTEYQMEKKSSKVTIDNIRRILSSFFSWLEDEDYIIKSPVRQIHKVKTNISIKETYTDEELERMRDSCSELRDLAMIDMLASTGMRVGEMVLPTDFQGSVGRDEGVHDFAVSRRRYYL